MTDSLGTPPASSVPGKTLSEEAAALFAGIGDPRRATSASFDLVNAERLVRIRARRPRSQPGILPTFGVGIGLPLFDRNRGAIAQAEAERDRASAELTLAQVEARNQIAHAIRAARNRAGARRARSTDRRQRRSRRDDVARGVSRRRRDVGERSRSAAEPRATVLAQYIDDLAAAWIATANLRVLAVSPSPRVHP